MAHHDELLDEAWRASRASRSAEAALLFRSTASAALAVGNRAVWFKAMVQAGISTAISGDCRGGLKLLLEARQSEPEEAPRRDAWLSRLYLAHITLSARPERSRLERLVADLRVYAGNDRQLANDVSEFEVQWAMRCGDCGKALGLCEATYQLPELAESSRQYLAYLAAGICTELGRFSDSREWLAALKRWKGSATVERYIADAGLDLALAEGQSPVMLRELLRIYMDRASEVQRDDTADILSESIVRVHLLDLDAGDPAGESHPSRAEFLRLPKMRQDVHNLFSRHLRYLDYRLACLRFAAGVPPVDDCFYRSPQRVPASLIPAHCEEFQSRLRKARTVAKATLRYALHLDNLLACNCRQLEVQARSERIEEIARAAVG